MPPMHDLVIRNAWVNGVQVAAAARPPGRLSRRFLA
jgi:hypothetical protein